MPVTLKPAKVIKADLGIEEGGEAHAFFTHDCRLHMNKYVPYSGDNQNRDHLREEVAETVDTITYEVPYAHAQYVGYTTGPVVNYTTPGTGPYWADEMWNAESEDVLKELADYIKLHSGGR